MIIILTNKDDVTVDFVVRELQRKGIEYYRLNTEDIPKNVAVDFSITENKFLLLDRVKNIIIDLNTVSAVYYRRAQISNLTYMNKVNMQEKKYLRGELAYLIEGIYKFLDNRYWLNNVYRIREAENKIYQLQIAQEIGFDIPDSALSNNFRTVNNIGDKYRGDCIIKPIKSGNIDPISSDKIIFTSKLEENFLKEKDRIEEFPIYIQRNIHKKCDLRCIVIGEKVYCAEIDSQLYEDSKIDWRKEKGVLPHTIHELPDNIKRKCIAMTQRLKLQYSAIDLILDEYGDYIFLECNPNGQWAWLEIRLGFPISTDIVRMLCNEGK